MTPGPASTRNTRSPQYHGGSRTLRVGIGVGVTGAEEHDEGRVPACLLGKGGIGLKHGDTEGTEGPRAKSVSLLNDRFSVFL